MRIGKVAAAVVIACAVIGGAPAEAREIHDSSVITTLAGTRTAGVSADGGQAAAAAVSSPAYVAVDELGRVYFTEMGAHRVRRVNLNGTIATVAGARNGTAGFRGDGGDARNALLRQPSGLAFDRNGDLYVADTGNRRIRRITPAGVITTIAGTGAEGSTGNGGPATAATFLRPVGLVARNGIVFVADSMAQQVRRIVVGGIITTVVGTGVAGFNGDGLSGTATQVRFPTAVALTANGQLLVGDSGNLRLRRLNLNNTVTTLAGNGQAPTSCDNAPAPGAIGGVTSIAVDEADTIYWSDASTRCIWWLFGGVVGGLFGTGVAGSDGDGAAVQFATVDTPLIALDDAGKLYVSDLRRHVVRVVAVADDVVACRPGEAVPSGYTLRQGTVGDDVIAGTAGRDLIRGLAGNDQINGNGGDDIICGGDDEDDLRGGAGSDRISGGYGQDNLLGEGGGDFLFGGVGTDTLNGGPAFDNGADLDPDTEYIAVEKTL